MNSRKLVGGLAVAADGRVRESRVCIAAAAPAGEDATLLRVFLKDGTSLVSYGEPATVGRPRRVFDADIGIDRRSAAASGDDLAPTRRLGPDGPVRRHGAGGALPVETRPRSHYAALTTRDYAGH